MWCVRIESNAKPHPNPGLAVVSLSRWLEQFGVTTCTAWRWRKKGWLTTINIAGRQYLTQEAIDKQEAKPLDKETFQKIKELVQRHDDAGVSKMLLALP